MSGISAKLPLDYDSIDGPYALNKTALDTIKQNLKMILLTNPGERVGDPAFGVGLKQSLFQQMTDFEFDRIRINILNQTKVYLPFLQILNVNFFTKEQNNNLEDNELNIRIQYYVPSLSQNDILNINVSAN